MKKIRIISWNVNGIRAIQKKGFLEWFKKESPDILCIQETKAHPEQLGEELLNIRVTALIFHLLRKRGTPE